MSGYWMKQASVRFNVREGTLYVEWYRPWGSAIGIEERKIASNVALVYHEARRVNGKMAKAEMMGLSISNLDGVDFSEHRKVARKNIKEVKNNNEEVESLQAKLAAARAEIERRGGTIKENFDKKIKKKV